MDALDSLVIDEAPPRARVVLVLDDESGDLARSALERDGAEVRGWCDRLDAQARLPEGVLVLDRLDAATLAGVDLVLCRLPKALGALDEWAELIAAHASPEVRVVAGGRHRHMTRGMNEALSRHFSEVRASLGRQKCRVLHAMGPLPGPITWPRSLHHRDLDLTVVAHGATFAGARIDPGTRLLLQHLDEVRPGAAVDAGSGNGVLAAALARQGRSVIAVDISASACASTRATADANGLAVTVLQADGLPLPPASVQAVVCNPPFHVGTAKDSSPAIRLFAGAAEILEGGGEFWCVFNSHLPYLGHLRELIGTTTVVARDRQYTLTRSRRRARG